jgi:hypothetical protein
MRKDYISNHVKILSHLVIMFLERQEFTRLEKKKWDDEGVRGGRRGESILGRHHGRQPTKQNGFRRRDRGRAGGKEKPLNFLDRRRPGRRVVVMMRLRRVWLTAVTVHAARRSVCPPAPSGFHWEEFACSLGLVEKIRTDRSSLCRWLVDAGLPWSVEWPHSDRRRLDVCSGTRRVVRRNLNTSALPVTDSLRLAGVPDVTCSHFTRPLYHILFYFILFYFILFYFLGSARQL